MQIYLVNEAFTSWENKYRAFISYSAAKTYFLAQLGQFFLNCVHDNCSIHKDNKNFGNFMKEEYPDGFYLEDGSGRTRNEVAETEEEFKNNYDAYMCMRYDDSYTLTMEITSLDETTPCDT